MARKLKAKANARPKGKRKPRPKTASKEAGAPVRVTNAQIRLAMFQADGNEAKAARALGISRTVLKLLLPEDAQPQPKPAEPDVSVAEFDAACRSKREERRKRLEAREAADREALYGHEAEPIVYRGLVMDAETQKLIGPDSGLGNPDELVVKAIVLLERRTPRNWGAMVCGAFGLLRQAVAAELARPIVSRRQFFERCETLRAVGPEADGDPEGSEGLE